MGAGINSSDSEVDSILDLPPIHVRGRDLCPVCGATLERTMMHYRVKGIYVGKVEALRCPLGHYYVLTERGYEEARKRAEEMGLLVGGLAEEPLEEWKESLASDNRQAHLEKNSLTDQNLVVVDAG